ncbi:molybdopterin containing oxidoreductase [Alteromonas aestuariivivens]|uniref:Molybdopterin containing oxidoreductase n=1 Tax=Alteromonas aestuariivivens TaxID=1938339 RepID=A0A3D8MFG7_9ALTE|nr:sulfite oxidase [Alteromonas aestuariivivens]RDV28938.1 molybdopterin containing oxidoreductase [Alteromonas aestuariivivens]
MKRRGLHELYAEDPVKADESVFGRTTNGVTRRGFLSGLKSMSLLLGAEIVYGQFMPAGLIPAAFAQSDSPFVIEGKDGLVILNDRPVNAETPAHLLDDDVTPASRFFVRNNGIVPQSPDANSWTLTIEGESAKQSRTFSLNELKQQFKHYTYQLTLECGGNGRAEFSPAATGNQWTTGAVGCPSWTGVRLKDVLDAVGIKDDAVYIGYYGDDQHLSRTPGKAAISRGVPVDKAMEDESLIAWAMNGKPLPLMNGFPLRLVFGGWPASTSGKWLKKIVVRNQVHDGAKMLGKAYRMPCKPIAPGADVADENMCIIEAMPVKSLITYPQSGIQHKLAQALEVRGHAWCGETPVEKVYTSIDFGQTWQLATLTRPVNRHAWQHFSTKMTFQREGYYEIWAKAEDQNGRTQPMVLPGWNPKGYLNNACHRIAVSVVV